jgi:hypothetical protein
MVPLSAERLKAAIGFRDMSVRAAAAAAGESQQTVDLTYATYARRFASLPAIPPSASGCGTRGL